jgi:hypothetical protein
MPLWFRILPPPWVPQLASPSFLVALHGSCLHSTAGALSFFLSISLSNQVLKHQRTICEHGNSFCWSFSLLAKGIQSSVVGWPLPNTRVLLGRVPRRKNDVAIALTSPLPQHLGILHWDKKCVCRFCECSQAAQFSIYSTMHFWSSIYVIQLHSW